MRVLHGPSGPAGQASVIARAQRELGIRAEAVAFSTSKFGYGADTRVELGADQLLSTKDYVRSVIDEYDVFHCYSRPYFYSQGKLLSAPSALDLLALRAAGKKVVFHFRGSEARTPSLFKQYSPYHYVDENPRNIFGNFPEEDTKKWIRFIAAVAHRVLVPDPELQSYVRGAQIVPRAIDLSQWKNIGQVNGRPLIVHAPSNRQIKGTERIVEAVAGLKRDGLAFDFQLVEDLTNDEARKVYERADVVVDQLRIGWYGVLAVESMALGKPCIAYIREDLVHHLGERPALHIANPGNIKEKLRDLIEDRERRRALGRNARTYCESVHDARKVAQGLLDLYASISPGSEVVPGEAVLDYLYWRGDVAPQSRYPRIQRAVQIATTEGILPLCQKSIGKVGRSLKAARLWKQPSVTK